MLLLIFLIFTQISASLRITKTQAASLLTGLNIFSYPNATECFEAVYSATTNQSYGQLISDSLSRMVEECPQASLNYLDDLDAHFKSFENSTAEQVMESFLFGLLSATPDLRQAAALSQQSGLGNLQTIELVGSALKKVLLFENVYGREQHKTDDLEPAIVKEIT